MMLFGEKYGDVVRVVEIAGLLARALRRHARRARPPRSAPFVILSEGSVGSGVRRIEAVTSGEAYALLHARAAEADELRAEIERLRKEAKRKPAAAGSRRRSTPRCGPKAA